MTHLGPDADGLGSQLALLRSARLAGRDAFIVNEDPCPSRYVWLDPDGEIGDFDGAAPGLARADLGLIFDAHEPDRAGRPVRRLRELAKPVWVVDHHPAGPTAEITGCIATEFSSTGELVYELLLSLGWPIDATVAVPLYAAMSFDTGSFRFLRNQARTLRAAAALLDTGMDANPVQEALFANRPRGEVELLGRVIAATRFADNGRIAWVVVEPEMLVGLDLANDAVGETIGTLIGTEGVLAAVQVKPGRVPGEWKFSLRSKTAVRIGHIAREVGGGGHDHAAGATFFGNPHDQARQVVAQVEAAIRAQVGAAPGGRTRAHAPRSPA
ncbi:MAG: DHH family phosphoesterase [Deltaproteobacteria bacterium]|nr:DHH family phosphoesterase [Deltaproteobacteria bacterium]